MLYEHGANEEAAGGVSPTPARVAVEASVSFRSDRTVTEQELVAFHEQGAAAYEFLRQIGVMDEPPKTAVGKLPRRGSRARGGPG